MNPEYNSLTPEEERVILHKGTERPFTGEYHDYKIDGVYLCRRCNAPLYDARDKFDSGCGWPSFDDEIPGAVKRVIDADGRRTEIICNNCGGHLGHVFIGEQLTEKNTRHCVNSLSMRFVPREKWEAMKPAERKTEKAVFAAGCFWGKEYFLSRIPGVIATRVGYTGGTQANPTYKEVCAKTTGHAEAVEVTYDPQRVSYDQLLTSFFDMHDVSIERRDNGGQYRSAIFYADDTQKALAESRAKSLESEGKTVTTEIAPLSGFWPAEARHQKYCDSHGLTPATKPSA